MIHIEVHMRRLAAGADRANKGTSPLINRIYAVAACCCVLTLSPVISTQADDDAKEGGERCVDTRRVVRSEVVDDQTILFYMRNGVIYRNTLPKRCRPLAHEERFSYSTRSSRLCYFDRITIVYDHGSGLTSGPSCALGRYYPITKEEAQALEGLFAIEAEPIAPAEPEQPEVASPVKKTDD